MITRIKSSRIISPEGFFSGYVYFDENQILQVTAEEMPCDKTYDAGDHYVSPGFIDMHVHGGNGFDFCKADAKGVAAATDFHLRHGTTSIVPTVTSVTYDAMCKSLDNIRLCVEAGYPQANIVGVHLEGPYFSPKQCGAQNPDSITAPIATEYNALLEKYGDLIKRWSYAPEVDQDLAFVEALAQHNVIPSMGHTDAIYDDCIRAFEKGCKLVTHLYSCTSTITRVGGYRRLGVLETAYLLDDMDVEIIADGKHLPPELIRLICKQKGYDRVSLVTDAMQLAGTNETISEIGGVPCMVEDGVAKLLDRSAFAGSVATTDRLLRVCIKDVGIPVLDAVNMITVNPARILGINAGKLQSGARPDVVVFDEDVNLLSVFVNGTPVIIE